MSTNSQPNSNASTVKENVMKVLKWAVVLLMAVLGLMAGAPTLASAAPDTQADVTYLHLLEQNGVSYPNPEAMVSYAHDLVDQLSASPQNDASVGSIVSTGEERISQHDMGVIIAAAVVAYRPSLIPVVRHWADSGWLAVWFRSAGGAAMKKLMTAVLAVCPKVRGSASDLRQVDVRSRPHPDTVRRSRRHRRHVCFDASTAIGGLDV